MEPDKPFLLGQPKGLFYLFFAELWERFSFYGMRALLILYMTTQLLYSDQMSFGIYAAYGSLVYATPLIGGILADKILGYRKAIILGGCLMAAGHFLLTIETPIFFYTSLGLLVVGNGFFKPNISSLVGTLYKEGDPRRESGFTLFYLGINIGGMVAPLLCAWLAAEYGWHYGFGAAGIGMLLGLITFYRGIQGDVFGDRGTVPNEVAFSKRILGIHKGVFIPVLAVVSVPIFALLIYGYEYEHYLIWLVALVVAVVLVMIARSVTKPERHRLLVIVYFTILATLFWAIFEQSGSSVTLFADRNVNLNYLNASQTNGINSAFIILLSLPFSFLWPWLDRKGWNPSTPAKFGIGLFLLGLGYLAFALSGNSADNLANTPMFYLVLGYFVLTVGEMFLSPIGLAKMTELSPAKFVSFLMGVWFLSSFFGHFFAGKIATLTSVEAGTEGFFSTGVLGKVIAGLTGLSYEHAEALGQNFPQLHSYVSTFAGIGMFAMSIGILAFILSPWVRKGMHGLK